MDSVTLRERIVIPDRESIAEGYRYTLYWGGEVRKTEKGLYLCDGEEELLRLYPPFWQDAKGEEIFTEPELSRQAEGVYAYSVPVPEQWLQSEDRAYPVVLDPDIGVPFKDYITDYHISSSGTVYDRDSLMVGSGNHFRAVIKPDLSTVTFPGDCFLQEADLVMARYVYDSGEEGSSNVPRAAVPADGTVALLHGGHSRAV